MNGTNKLRLLKAAGALIIGMALLTGLVGCKTDDDDESGGFPAAKGKLTVTDIPANYNGKYAQAYASNADRSVMLLGIAGGDSETYKLVKIADGTAVLPLYKVDSSDRSVSAYEGNDTLMVYVQIFNEETIAASSTITPVTQIGGSVIFASGSKSVKWTDF